MITKAEIINQPISGEYNERIYDIESPWNSPNWTWVRFEDESDRWCGEFRGKPRKVVLSTEHRKVLVRTSDYLYVLDCDSAEIIEYESQPQYSDLAVTPYGDFLVTDYYSIKMFGENFAEKEIITSPIQMDLIQFHEWVGNRLSISCCEFLNWERKVELYLDIDTKEMSLDLL